MRSDSNGYSSAIAVRSDSNGYSSAIAVRSGFNGYSSSSDSETASRRSNHSCRETVRVPSRVTHARNLHVALFAAHSLCTRTGTPPTRANHARASPARLLGVDSKHAQAHERGGLDASPLQAGRPATAGETLQSSTTMGGGTCTMTRSKSSTCHARAR